MDYEKKYNEALKRARELSKTTTGANYEYIFPELKETEDELTWLKNYISEEAYYLSMDIRDSEDSIKLQKLQKSLAWLEKQGNKDSQVTIPTFTFDDVLALQCCMETVKKVQEDNELYEQLQSLHDRLHDAYWLEKQSQTFTKKDVDDAWLKGMCDAKHELEKQGEKPNNIYDKELSKILGSVICRYINDPNISYVQREKVSKEIIPYVESLEKQGKQSEQKLVEWNEEDEGILNSFLHKLEVCDLLSNKEIIWFKDKLKSLKSQAV